MQNVGHKPLGQTSVYIIHLAQSVGLLLTMYFISYIEEVIF